MLLITVSVFCCSWKTLLLGVCLVALLEEDALLFELLLLIDVICGVLSISITTTSSSLLFKFMRCALLVMRARLRMGGEDTLGLLVESNLIQFII